MRNLQLGGREKDANFLILMTVIPDNSVLELILIVIGKEILSENVALIFTLVHATLLNITLILFVLMKIMN
jgi:hypothetical protein